MSNDTSDLRAEIPESSAPMETPPAKRIKIVMRTSAQKINSVRSTSKVALEPSILTLSSPPSSPPDPSEQASGDRTVAGQVGDGQVLDSQAVDGQAEVQPAVGEPAQNEQAVDQQTVPAVAHQTLLAMAPYTLQESSRNWMIRSKLLSYSPIAYVVLHPLTQPFAIHLELLKLVSGHFSKAFPHPVGSNWTIKEPGIEPIFFEDFVSWIYQGKIYRLEAYDGTHSFYLSAIKMWFLGAYIQCPGFQNAAIKYLRAKCFTGHSVGEWPTIGETDYVMTHAIRYTPLYSFLVHSLAFAKPLDQYVQGSEDWHVWNNFLNAPQTTQLSNDVKSCADGWAGIGPWDVSFEPTYLLPGADWDERWDRMISVERPRLMIEDHARRGCRKSMAEIDHLRAREW